MSIHRRSAVLVLLTLAVGAALAGLAACGSSAAPSQPPTTSGVQGSAVVDAGCPVLRGASTCPDRPITARLTVRSAGSDRSLASVTTDADGRFRIPMAPGSYVLHPANTTGAPVPLAPDLPFTVTADHFTTLTVTFDSGVR